MTEQENNVDKTKGIIPLTIQDEMKSCYLDYAMSVIVGRALPDVRDGLKPVHRRILYAMHVLNNYYNKPFMKSARIVGEVIGKYHPHGDSSVYGTVVRLAQDFSMRYTLIDGQGNFGSIDGDNAAAMRYTEVRMDKMTDELLRDIEKETVDWGPNYDDSLKEPLVLPTKLPNLLINGSTGIAVGMATNIPPHNLGEVMNGLIALIDRPDLTISDLLKIIPGPDFPTGGSIHGPEGIRSAYYTGKGIIQIRGNAEIETIKNRDRIIIHELPYQVIKSRLIERVAQLVNNKDISGISDIRDESNKLGIRVVIDLKRGENGHVILNRLYKHTQLQVSYGIIFLSIHNKRPKVMHIKEMLEAFIEHRREVIVRKTRYELKKASEKAHILEGLRLAVQNMDAIIEMIKKAESPSVAKASLMSKYPLSEIQAQAILDMRLQRLTGLEQDKIIKDYAAVMKEIARLKEILDSEILVNNIIKAEFLEMKEKYQDPRRTQIMGKAEEILEEDLVTEEEVIVTVTHKGYIKRMGLDTYRSQRRGGKGVKGAEMNDDFYNNIFVANTLSSLMIFTNQGNVFSLKVYEIPEGSRTAKGRNIINLIPIGKNEKIRSIISLPKEFNNKFVVMATENGLVKKTELAEYKRINANGKKGIKITDDDSLLCVRIIEGNEDIFLCSSSGKVIRFSGGDLRPQGRVSQGVKGIKLDAKEKVIGMEIIESDETHILTVTENGFGKRTKASEYRSQTRGGKGIIGMKLGSRNGAIRQILPVSDSDDLMIITNAGQVIRMKMEGVSLIGRATQGVRLIKLNKEEKVVAVERILDSDDDDDSSGDSSDETPIEQ